MSGGRPAPVLTPLEVASGVVLGRESRVALPAAPGALDPLGALECEILPALRSPPCLVSFSGGRDSSAVLAVATALARRHGLEPPIPVTNRFLEAPGAEESAWQERVIGHLGLHDWHRLELTDELDAVGPVARRGLERHGLLWPFNAHFHVPLLEAAAGGTLLTGIGGDEAFGESRWARADAVLSGRARPVPRDLLTLGLAFSPVAVRSLILRGRAPECGWLSEGGQRAFARALAGHEAAEPRLYAPRLAWWHGLRAFRVGLESLSLLALDAGAAIAHPLASPAFAAALARTAPRRGPEERGAFMRRLFGALLPADVYARGTKARFDEAFWRADARAVAAAWEGEGADPGLVDAQRLREEWGRPVPDPHTYTLLQAAWLSRPRAPATPAPPSA